MVFLLLKSFFGEGAEKVTDRDHKSAKPKALPALYRSLLTPDLTQPFILQTSKTEAQRGQMTPLRSHSTWVIELGQ